LALTSKKNDVDEVQPPEKQKTMRLLNMWVTKSGVNIPDGKGGNTKIVVGPLEVSPPLPEWLAEKLLESSDESKSRAHGWVRPIWQSLPEPGDCKNKQDFPDKRRGDKIQTCTYGECPQPGHAQSGRLHHSIQQSYWLIRSMPHAAAIRSYIMMMDTRPLVVAFGERVAQHREAELRRQMHGTDKITSPLI